jgi:MYXO-CTERM domain-containing protein
VSPRRTSLAALALALAISGTARADDGGDAGDDAEAGVQPTTTGDNWTCDASAPGPRGAPGSSALPWLAAAGLLLHRRRRRATLVVSALVALLSARTSRAADEVGAPPPEPEPVARRLAIYVSPLSLLVDRYGGSLEIMLASHHALEAGAYYVYCATNSDSANLFEGVGGEVGYRFYLGRNGPRGFYIGPSFLLASMTAVPQAGPSMGYLDLGGALDLGYQALVVDRVLVGLGVGAQYTAATQSLPQQQVPASVYANGGLRPRVSLAIGVAF